MTARYGAVSGTAPPRYAPLHDASVRGESVPGASMRHAQEYCVQGHYAPALAALEREAPVFALTLRAGSPHVEEATLLERERHATPALSPQVLPLRPGRQAAYA